MHWAWFSNIHFYTCYFSTNFSSNLYLICTVNATLMVKLCWQHILIVLTEPLYHFKSTDLRFEILLVHILTNLSENLMLCTLSLRMFAFLTQFCHKQHQNIGKQACFEYISSKMSHYHLFWQQDSYISSWTVII